MTDQHSSTNNADGPCFYCGEQTSQFAGDPGRWPLVFCRNGTGIAKHHHARCVADRLSFAQQQPAADRIEALSKALDAAIHLINTLYGADQVIDDAVCTFNAALVPLRETMTEEQHIKVRLAYLYAKQKIAADKGWQCHAKLRPEAAGCMWPDCGCEPRATEVIAELVEQGWSAPVSKPGNAVGARDEEIKSLEGRLAALKQVLP